MANGGAPAGGGEEAMLQALARVDRLGQQGRSSSEIAAIMSDEAAPVPGGTWNDETVERILGLFQSVRSEVDEDDIVTLAVRTADIPRQMEEQPPLAPIPPIESDRVELAVAGPDQSRRWSVARLALIGVVLAGVGAGGFLAIDSMVGNGGSSSELIGEVAAPTTNSTNDSTTTTESPDPADTMAIRIETEQPVAEGDLTPATATIRLDGKLHVEGTFTSQEAAETFLTEAGEVFGPDNIVESFAVDPAAPIPEVADVALDKPVLFESGTAEIHPDYIPFLEACAGVLTLNPKIVMSVTGYTDSVGDDDFNLELSRRRAQAIIDFYRDREIGDDQLLAIGAGEADPVAANDTNEGRSANRRAMLQLLNVVGDAAEDLE